MMSFNTVVSKCQHNLILYFYQLLCAITTLDFHLSYDKAQGCRMQPQGRGGE